jgi:hypothetical protein
VANFLIAFGLGIRKTNINNNGQAAGVVIRKQKKSVVAQGGQRAVIAVVISFLKVKGQQIVIDVVAEAELAHQIYLPEPYHLQCQEGGREYKPTQPNELSKQKSGFTWVSSPSAWLFPNE